MTGAKLNGVNKYQVVKIPRKTIVDLLKEHGDAPSFWAELKKESALRGLIYNHVVGKWDHLVEVGPRIKAWWENNDFCQLNYDVSSGCAEHKGIGAVASREVRGGKI
jgi:hypothetical protein